jgi:histone-lysine N-methyltransferase SETDB1
VVSEDISLGRERNILLPCVNEVDSEVPPVFTYVASNVESASVLDTLRSRKDPDFLVCCDCTDGCTNPATCACIRLSNGVGDSLVGGGCGVVSGAASGNSGISGSSSGGGGVSGGRLPTPSYSTTTGRLMEPRLAVYECGAACRCRSTCFNRVVGSGPVLPLEVFRCTPIEKGWGVRCKEDVPAGTFIACYQGELLDEVRNNHVGA